MALIKNDIKISDKEFKLKLKSLEKYISMMPTEIKNNLLNESNFFQTYSSTLFKSLEKGKEGVINFNNFNDQQICEFINSVSVNMFKIKSTNNKKINNDSDRQEYTEQFLQIQQNACEYVSQDLQYYNREIKYDYINPDELSIVISDICTNNLSDENKDSFANDYNGYDNYYTSISEKISEELDIYLNQMREKQVSNPQL